MWKTKKHNRVLNGIDRIDTASPLLRGKRLALMTAASGIDRNGKTTYEILSDKYGVFSLFVPENELDNGVFKDAVSLESDEETIRAALAKTDTVVYDIQDTGARSCPYIKALADMMKRVSELGKDMVVLDRINLIGGGGIEGLVGSFSIPTRYGLTVGELARYLNTEEGIGCRLEVVPLGGWDRRSYAEEAGLLWIDPSDDIPSVNSAINQIGIGIFEATNISLGKGTLHPYELVGAPFVDASRLCERMRAQKLDGVIFTPAGFTPKFDKYAGERCEGICIHITDRNAYSPFETMLYLYRELSYYREFEYSYNGVCECFGNDMLCGEFIDPEQIMKQSCKETLEYRKKAAKYLMY